jgi:hypothetical protein
VIVDGRFGHRRARFDDDAGQRSDRGPQGAVALSPGHARPLAPAALTASRHLSKISVTVRPLGPSHRPRTTRRRPCRAACSARLWDGAGSGPNVARDMPACCLVACGVLAWARPARPCGRNACPDSLSLSGECRRPSAEAQTPGHAYAIMRSKGESLSAGEGARHVGHY